ncbi:MAG: methyltransferase domain-containing protein [Bryobacteraceae bacterium]
MKFGVSVKPAAGKPSTEGPGVSFTRHSSGFDQFCAMLQGAEGLSILDMSGASQANISFITGLGHRISSDDLVGTMEQFFGKGDFMEGQEHASNAQRFLDQCLTFPDSHFDGALVWDTLQFLSGHVLDQAIAQLLRVMRPGGLILAFFHADEKATRIPLYNYRVQDQKTLLLVPRGGYQRVQYFNNRALERMFDQAGSLKFFLTRDHLREVIVRR